MPKFQGGGLNKYVNWVNSQVVFPEEAKQNGITKGKIKATIIVEADGSVSAHGVMSTLPNGKAFADEVIRVIELSPKWTPGSNDGRPVRMLHNFTINFNQD